MQPNVTVSATAPDPFNHGTAGIRYRPVSEATRRHVIAILSEAWGFDSAGTVEEVDRHTAYSHNYRVAAKQETYILRESLINNPVAQRSIDECKSYARANGLPVPEILVTRAGETFYEERTLVYSLSRAVDGDHFDGSVAELENSARLLARFHQVFRDYPKAREVHRIQGEVYPDDAHEWASIKSMAQDGGTDFDKWALELIAHVEQGNSVYTSDLMALPQHLGHFDWNPHNLLFNRRDKSVAGLLDFDLMRISYRAKDVGLGMHKFSRVFGVKTECKEDIGASIAGRCRRFLAAYCESVPLEAHEIEAIPRLIFDETKRKIVYILGRHYNLNEPSSNFDLPKQLVLIKELEMLKELV